VASITLLGETAAAAAAGADWAIADDDAAVGLTD